MTRMFNSVLRKYAIIFAE